MIPAWAPPARRVLICLVSSRFTSVAFRAPRRLCARGAEHAGNGRSLSWAVKSYFTKFTVGHIIVTFFFSYGRTQKPASGAKLAQELTGNVLKCPALAHGTTRGRCHVLSGWAYCATVTGFCRHVPLGALDAVRRCDQAGAVAGWTLFALAAAARTESADVAVSACLRDFVVTLALCQTPSAIKWIHESRCSSCRASTTSCTTTNVQLTWHGGCRARGGRRGLQGRSGKVS